MQRDNTTTPTPEPEQDVSAAYAAGMDVEEIIEEQGPESPAAEGLTPEEAASKRTQYILIGAGVAFLVLLFVVIFLLASYPKAASVVRDIALIFVAVETFLIGLAMILLIFQLQVLIQVLRDEIQPLLRSVNDTASTVRGTTEFVSHSVVSPLIKAAGFTAGVRRVASNLLYVAKTAVRSPQPKPNVQVYPKVEEESNNG